jgi:hypothetical protein
MYKLLCVYIYIYGDFHQWGYQNEWFLMAHPIKIGDLEVPLFQETTICVSSC